MSLSLSELHSYGCNFRPYSVVVGSTRNDKWHKKISSDAVCHRTVSDWRPAMVRTSAVFRAAPPPHPQL